MLLRRFPDINLVRQLKNNAASGGQEWRNVVLNFSCSEASRLHLESPYSLFINRKGHSECTVNGRSYRVETDTFLLAQPGDLYGLTIDNIQQTEICNIHISKRFFDYARHSMYATHEVLLEQAEPPHDPPLLLSRLYLRDPAINKIINLLCLEDTYQDGKFEDSLQALVQHLLGLGGQAVREADSLPFARTAVRQDIYRKLAVATDYMRSCYNLPFSLDAVCNEAAMSKFHFLRVFKEMNGISPQQFVNKLRMDKAAQMLKNTDLSINSISDELGFEFPNSFIRAFGKAYATSPLQYRKAISNIG